jgi:hypothetical protein
VGHAAQRERPAQLAPLGQQRHQAAVVGAQGLAQHQEGEELRLGIIVPGAGAGIGRQGGAADRQRLAGEPHR